MTDAICWQLLVISVAFFLKLGVYEMLGVCLGKCALVIRELLTLFSSVLLVLDVHG